MVQLVLCITYNDRNKHIRIPAEGNISALSGATHIQGSHLVEIILYFFHTLIGINALAYQPKEIFQPFPVLLKLGEKLRS